VNESRGHVYVEGEAKQMVSRGNITATVRSLPGEPPNSRGARILRANIHALGGAQPWIRSAASSAFRENVAYARRLELGFVGRRFVGRRILTRRRGRSCARRCCAPRDKIGRADFEGMSGDVARNGARCSPGQSLSPISQVRRKKMHMGEENVAGSQSAAAR